MYRDHPPETHGSLYARIAEATEKPLLADILFEVGTAFGFHGASFMIMPARNQNGIAELVLETNLPRDFYEKHDQLTGIGRCSVYGACRNSILPSIWQRDKEERQLLVVADPPSPTLQHYADHLIVTSLLVPLRSLDASQYLVRFDGNRQVPNQHEINDLSMLAMAFFQGYDRLRYPLSQNPGGLTDREIEIIAWTATGKTSTEIGRILSLSDHTVNAHISNSFKKLDCVTRAQLVAKALKMRVIS